MKKRVRVIPSKGQSIIGFIVGLLFCAIGVFEVIPHAGIFGIVWTLIAVIITVINAINIWAKNGIATEEIIVDEDEKNDNKNKSIEDRLIEAQQLHEKGTITTEEYEEKRKQLLDRI